MSNKDLGLYHQMMDGDKKALESIYDKYEKLLYSFVIKLSGDQTLAEEVLQEVFIKLWTNKATYDETKGKFSSWIVTITRYTAIDIIRKNKNQTVALEEETDLPEQVGDSTEDIVEWKEQGDKIRKAVKELSNEQKQMVDLFYFKGLSQQEIANQCDLPLGTVKGRIRLALKHLKTHLTNGKGGVNDA
ncbi:sigma-70 family RNA polymerase sigma factor [Halobacillus shinanisalinarum]|uniref:Sigma-70 family RNA polymerase sigma factor n=1 Tax=Halobacillus shinanisalinarum TaxID=2932258 RepID=A0ABY4GU66_9BACI|nr:sigma-70 family RNA polymerase sigma factor [Halobacillus shinanisalinarum]UOQ91705.1 sigma-70 family RNA polymerase sigma factor [Halobacillus shinanisalinarum]